MDTKALIEKYSNMVTDLKEQLKHIETLNVAGIKARINGEISIFLMVIRDLEALEGGTGSNRWIIVLHNTKAGGERLESSPHSTKPSEKFAQCCADLYGASHYTIELKGANTND